jgi:hypothetical protein
VGSVGFSKGGITCIIKVWCKWGVSNWRGMRSGVVTVDVGR